MYENINAAMNVNCKYDKCVLSNASIARIFKQKGNIVEQRVRSSFFCPISNDVLSLSWMQYTIIQYIVLHVLYNEVTF